MTKTNETEAFPTRLDQITFLFDDVPRMLRKVIDRVLIEHNLSRTQWRLLAYALRDEGMTQTGLAQRLEIERATVGKAVDTLEKKGMITRAKAKNDRRVWRIVPTDEARELLPALRETVDDIYRQMFVGVADDEIDNLRETLKQLAANLGSLNHQVSDFLE
ncbi:MarR family winged helix-turn-helix transcriptional regulator [Parasphingorhabdus sp.]|uniref:MarR family winged helix-turn-helix transcriptional regulator n=1 Tax=Parasphingorhabdus sp. TaxID=2709688 RepID=UPI003BAE7C97